jgi:outer membrane protein TolC
MAAAGMALSLGACTVGPNFNSPRVNVPLHWWPAPSGKVPSQTVEAPVDVEWWQAFTDRELTQLEKQVPGANIDGLISSTRLLQSRAQRQVVAAAQLPSLDSGGSFQRNRASPNGILASTGVSPTGSTSSADPKTFGLASLPGSEGPPAFHLCQCSLNASWKLDLWGRIRRGVEAADASQQAAAEIRQEVNSASLEHLSLKQSIQVLGNAVAPIVRRTTAAAQPMTDKENPDG